MRIRYMLSYPMNLDHGGGSRFAEGIITNLKNKGTYIEQLNWRDEKIDFDILFVFGFTFINFEILKGYKNKSIEIIVFPIFDRVHPKIVYKAGNFFDKILRIKSLGKIRKINLELSDKIVVLNEVEKNDIVNIYKIERKKIFVLNLGLTDDIFLLSKSVDKNLFLQSYHIKDFVVFPSAKISKRKNQIQLLKSLKGTTIPVVLTGTDEIEPDVRKEFLELTSSNKNVLCLPKLTREMLVSCLKCAKVCVSLSSSETAGLSNLEAGYLGCNLVVNDIPPFREYLKNWAVYVNKNNLKEIKERITEALSKDYDDSIKSYITINYTWNKYCDNLLRVVSSEDL